MPPLSRSQPISLHVSHHTSSLFSLPSFSAVLSPAVVSPTRRVSLATNFAKLCSTFSRSVTALLRIVSGSTARGGNDGVNEYVYLGGKRGNVEGTYAGVLYSGRSARGRIARV